MAPRKRNTKQKRLDSVKIKKVEAFLQDFDGEVKAIVERLKVKKNDLLRKSQNAYDMALIKLPKQIRQMNWLEYYRSEKAKEQEVNPETRDVAAKVDTVLAVVHDIPPTVKKTASKKKAPVKSNSEDEEYNTTVTVKKGRTAKKPPRTTTKKAAGLSVSKQSTATRRSNRKPLVTPARSNMLDSSLLVGATPLITPKFDPRLPKTPAVRIPRHKERVYSISVNGSPVAPTTEDVVISVPIGNGECIQLLASQMDSVDLSSLDENALRSIQQLQNQLAAFCGQSQ